MLPNNARIADFVDHIADSSLPDDVVDMARRSLLDWFAVSLSATAEPEAVTVSQYIAGWSDRGGAVSVFGHNGAAAPVAFVNATLAHLLDFDDINYDAALHAGAPTWAAALALGMARGIGARRVLNAFIAGYEVAAALGINGTGLALANRGWHPTAVLAHFSSVVAASVLLRLDRTRLSSALGTAATQASGLVAAGGTASKPLQVGKAAMAGVIAAEMAEMNVNGTGTLIESDHLGLFPALIGHDVSLGEFATTWHILGNSFKPFASCGFTHSTIEAAQTLSRVVSVPEIIRVKVFGNPLALQVAGHLHPHSGSEARFSLSYAAALGLLGCDATPAEFGDDHLHRPDIGAILDRTELVIDSSLERWSSRVELTLHDDRSLSETVLVPKGMGHRSLAWSDLEAKFLAVAPARFGTRAQELLAAIRTFGEGGEVESIHALLLSPMPQQSSRKVDSVKPSTITRV
jgi:2-methylcitrate dehydratase PrpD